MPTANNEVQRKIENNVNGPLLKSTSILGDPTTSGAGVSKIKHGQVTYPLQGNYTGVRLNSPAKVNTSTSTPVEIVEGGSGSNTTTIIVPAPPAPPIMPNLGYGQVLVSGQTTLMANRYMAPITFAAGNNITITTSNGTSTSGGVLTISSSDTGVLGITVQSGGNTVVASANTINFVGSVTASNVSGIATVAVTAAGSNTQIQFNNNGQFSGIPTVLYNTLTNKLSLGNIANINISGGSNGYVMTTDGAGNLSWAASGGGGGGGNATFDTITTTNLIFGGTGPINLDSGNDLNLSAAGDITMNGEPVITLTTLQSVVAASTSFSDFQTRIAAL